jgi:hypothetical protein
MKTFQEFMVIAEGMTMKDFKKQRSRQKQKDKRAADKIAPGRRAGIHDDKASPERAARHRANVDPDFEGNDERNYPGGKLKNSKKIRKAKALGELGEEFVDEGIGMTVAGALGNPPALSKRMKLKQALIINKIKSDAKKNAEKKYSGKAATSEEFVNEAGDYWNPDPEKDKRISGVGNKLRAREDSLRTKVSKVDSNKLKPGETYMQYAKRKAAEKSVSTKKKPSLRDRIVKKVGSAIDRVAGIKNEEYDLSETSLNRVRSKSEKGGMAIMSAQRGDKSKKENKARSKQLEKDIRGAGLPGPTKVSGRYTENPGTDKEKKVGEKSHVVSSGKMGKRKFKKAITKLGKKYNQDSVLIQKKPKGDAQLVGTNKSWPGEGKRVKVGKMNPGKTGEFDTKVKNKTFTYEAKIDDGLTKDEKQIARNKRAGITNNPYIGNKGGQDSYRREKHIFDRYEKKVRGEK